MSVIRNSEKSIIQNISFIEQLHIHKECVLPVVGRIVSDIDVNRYIL